MPGADRSGFRQEVGERAGIEGPLPFRPRLQQRPAAPVEAAMKLGDEAARSLGQYILGTVHARRRVALRALAPSSLAHSIASDAMLFRAVEDVASVHCFSHPQFLLALLSYPNGPS